MSPKSVKSNDKKQNKSFDKTQWRNKKYNHKAKVQEFEERRRKSALHKYYKELRKSQLNSVLPKTNSVSVEQQGEETHKKREVNPYERAKQELDRRKQEKQQLREALAKQKADREEALLQYRKDKIRKYSKLKQKTKKGQPVMAGRMELLLEKIQKNSSL